MSITELTTASAWVAGLAIVALIAAGWRKPARAVARPPRAPRDRMAVLRRGSQPDAPVRPRRVRRGDGVPVIEVEAPLHRGTPLWRRLWAFVASGVLGVVTGAMLATVVTVVVAYAVVTLTTLLRR